MNNSQAIPLQIKILVVITLISVFLAGLTSYTKYIFAEDYYFFVEAPCDPVNNLCHVRDCEEYCPPNALASYNVYRIKASEYEKCDDNTCLNVCNDTTKCSEIICSEEDGNSCNY